MDEWIFVCGLYVLFHDSVINYIYIFILLYNYIVMLCLNWTHLCLLHLIPAFGVVWCSQHFSKHKVFVVR